MQNSNFIVGVAIIIILLAVGYAFLGGEDAQNNTAVDLVYPERLSQPEQFQSKIPSKAEDASVSREKESAAIIVPVPEEMPSDESSLPTGLPPEDAILDPDAEEMVYDADAAPVNIGEYLDPDSEASLTSASGAEDNIVNIGEFMDPDADPLTIPSDAEEIPQHIGEFMDPDADPLTIPSDVEETPQHIGEHIEPE